MWIQYGASGKRTTKEHSLEERSGGGNADSDIQVQPEEDYASPNWSFN